MTSRFRILRRSRCELAVQSDKLGFLGSSDLPQSSQGIGGFLNGLLLGKVWIPGENRSVPIVRGSFAPDPSQCNLKLSLQFLSTQVAPPTLRIDPIKTSPASTANTKSSGTVEQNTCRLWQGQGVSEEKSLRF